MTFGDTSSLARYVAGGPLESLVQVEPAAYNLDRLETDQVRLSLELAGTGLAVDLNVKRNRVEIQVPVGVNAVVADMLSDGVPPTAVIVQGVEPREPVVNLYGGHSLTTCTSGFAIYYGSNQSNRGITTAGHCPNSQSWNGQALSYQNDEHWSGNYDAQSHKLSGAAYKNWIQDDPSGHTRSITAKEYRLTQYVGRYVCHYGMTTGYGCGYIVSDHEPGCSAVPGNRYIKVDSDPNGPGFDLAEGGDSGGPWFIGYTALGTMSCQQGYDAIYSTTGYVESPLGASILTSP